MNFMKLMQSLVLFFVLSTTALGGFCKPACSSSDASTGFNGVWVGENTISLIKQIGDQIVLQGQDSASVWSMRGIVNGDIVIARGAGEWNDGRGFVIESQLSIDKDGVITDTRKVYHSGGKVTEDEGRLTRANVLSKNDNR